MDQKTEVQVSNAVTYAPGTDVLSIQVQEYKAEYCYLCINVYLAFSEL